jgi:hypothetical protein
VEALDQPQEDAHLLASSAWDALDDARPDARDVADLRRAPSDADAEKLAGPAPDAQARDAWFRPQALLPAQWAPQAAAAELYTPDVVLSAEQSSAERAASVPKLPVLPDAGQSLEAVTQPML